MKYLILLGSPRKKGNTIKFVEPFMEELKAAGNDVDSVWLYDKTIRGCEACRSCQQDWFSFGCKFKDDMYEIFDKILAVDVLVLATPIYSWYCTAPMKATLDRLMYGMNKYYGEERGPSLWAGKHLALLETCGYNPEKGSDLFEEGIRRYCEHSQLIYDGSLALRDLGYRIQFATEEKILAAQDFAKMLMATNLNG